MKKWRLPEKSRKAASPLVRRDGCRTERPLMRLLILEDNELIRRALERQPWPEHVEVVLTARLAEAMEAVESGVDLVLSDVMLNPGFGTELHTWLTKTHPDLAKSMVFMTGGVSDAGVAMHLGRLLNKVVEKPFLRKALMAALGMSRAA